MHSIAATSLLVIALVALAAWAWPPGTACILLSMLRRPFLLASLVGMLVGRRVSRRLSQAAVQRSFAWMVCSSRLFIAEKRRAGVSLRPPRVVSQVFSGCFCFTLLTCCARRLASMLLFRSV